MSKVQVGDKVVVTDVHNIRYSNVMTVRYVYEDGRIDVTDGLSFGWLKPGQYEVKGDSLDLIANLSAEVVRLSKRVEALESALLKRPVAGSDGPGRLLTREEVIEKAKRDVAELEAQYGIDSHFNYLDYVVNKEKRTVVALLKTAYVRSLNGRGVAKCAPNDCFNVHIGKAIALRRALGLEVPQEYVKAPKPTEVKAGDTAILSI